MISTDIVWRIIYWKYISFIASIGSHFRILGFTVRMGASTSRRIVLEMPTVSSVELLSLLTHTLIKDIFIFNSAGNDFYHICNF